MSDEAKLCQVFFIVRSGTHRVFSSFVSVLCYTKLLYSHVVLLREQTRDLRLCVKVDIRRLVSFGFIGHLAKCKGSLSKFLSSCRCEEATESSQFEFYSCTFYFRLRFSDF